MKKNKKKIHPLVSQIKNEKLRHVVEEIVQGDVNDLTPLALDNLIEGILELQKREKYE